MLPGKPGASAGTGGLLLWPLFGATNQLLGTIGLLTVGLQAWMILESLLAWRHANGVLETALKREPAPKI